MKRGHSMKPRKRSGQLPLNLTSDGQVYVLDDLTGLWGGMFDVYADTTRTPYMGIPRMPENRPFALEYEGSWLTDPPTARPRVRNRLREAAARLRARIDEPTYALTSFEMLTQPELRHESIYVRGCQCVSCREYRRQHGPRMQDGTHHRHPSVHYMHDVYLDGRGRQ